MTARVVSGIAQPLDPPEGSDALAAVMHYLVHYEEQFTKARRVVKRRASTVLVVAGVGNTVVVVIGGVVTTWPWLSWMGIVSSGLAAAVAAVLAWDNHFRHRDLWVQRSIILQRLQEARRNAEMTIRLDGAKRDALARSSLEALNSILSEDIAEWAEIRGSLGAVPQRGQDGGHVDPAEMTGP